MNFRKPTRQEIITIFIFIKKKKNNVGGHIVEIGLTKPCLKFQDLLQKSALSSVTEFERRILGLTESVNVAEKLKVEGGAGYWDNTESVARKAGVSYDHTHLSHF